jgi:hypothetical protein
MATIKLGTKVLGNIAIGRATIGNVSKRAPQSIIKATLKYTQSNNNVIGPNVSNSLYDGNTQWDDSKVWDDSVTINFN